MGYDSKAIANYFLSLAQAQGQSLTPMKLQKLVYFAQGWHLAIRNGKTLIDEQVEAWRFGPVIPSLYRAFREFGDQGITEPASYFVVDEPSHSFEDMDVRKITPTVDDLPDNASETKAFLKRIWDVYGGYSAIQLSNLTHQIETPWYQVNQEYEGAIPKGTDIPSDSIKTYFQTLAKRA